LTSDIRLAVDNRSGCDTWEGSFEDAIVQAGNDGNEHAVTTPLEETASSAPRRQVGEKLVSGKLLFCTSPFWLSEKLRFGLELSPKIVVPQVGIEFE
jgi:hypothetical protein